MNTFKQKSLYAALAGLGALGAGSRKRGVGQPDGLGQVLIYPYYTVRDRRVGGRRRYNSLLSVVNSTASAKAVKVRFLEGKNSREVLDFNLYLSAKDVWIAAIIPTTDGAGIFTPDKSCTDPTVSQDEQRPDDVRQLRLHRARLTTRAARRSTVRVKATSKSSRWATSCGATADYVDPRRTACRALHDSLRRIGGRPRAVIHALPARAACSAR